MLYGTWNVLCFSQGFFYCLGARFCEVDSFGGLADAAFYRGEICASGKVVGRRKGGAHVSGNFRSTERKFPEIKWAKK